MKLWKNASLLVRNVKTGKSKRMCHLFHLAFSISATIILPIIRERVSEPLFIWLQCGAFLLLAFILRELQ